MEMQPSMLLVTAEFNEFDSFKLIPMSKDCPFSEGIYDMKNKVLALMGHVAKDSLHLVPKLDNHGDVDPAKRARKNGNQYKEERVRMETFVEYYVSLPKEIDDIIKRIAINAKTFDYKKFIKAPKPGENQGENSKPAAKKSVKKEKTSSEKPAK